MTVEIHTELRTGRLPVPHHPQSGDVVAGVKRIRRVDEEKSPFLLVILLVRAGADCVHCTLYISLETNTQLRISACVLGIGTGYFKNSFCE